MEIIKLNIDDIKHYENNAKMHPREQIEQIKKSIQDFGNNDPIAVDENNVIIEGHGRHIALKELGYTEAECIRLEHLTEEQKKAYILVHNKLTINTGFDLKLLDRELAELNLDLSEYDFPYHIDDSFFDDMFTDKKDKTKKKKTIICPHCNQEVQID